MSSFMPSFIVLLHYIYEPSLWFLFSSCKYIPLCTCPNHFYLASLNLSPNHSTWAVLLKCFFLILSILVTPNENLSIVNSATSSLSTFHFIPLSAFCYPTQTPTAALLEVSGSGRFAKFYYYLHKQAKQKEKTLQMSNKLPGCHFSLIHLFRLDTDTHPCDISPRSESL